MVILLVGINGYLNWWLSMVILLVGINGYFIDGY
jgi:hypothetical protein